MKDFRVLRFLDRFAALFERLGADYILMRKILHIKLTMDGRKIPTALNRDAGSDEKDRKNNFLRSLWIYVLMGIITIPFIIMGDNYIFQMSLVFGIYLFMIMSTLISDFSSVLLDIRDKNVLASRPVNHRTISMAKTIHVLIYMTYISAAFAGIPAVVSLIRHGALFFLIFIAEVILADLFIVVITALLYLLILKFFDGEKLKDIINYVQIVLTIVITVGYQLIGRLFNFTDYSAVFVPKWWQCFIAPVWFGAPFEVLVKGTEISYYHILSALSVLIPTLSFLLYIRLMPDFERNLQKLGSHTGGRHKQGLKRSDKIAKAICFNREERLFFRFASDLMRNERDFKLKVYPSLGLSMIFPFIFILNVLGSNPSGHPLSANYCFHIYFGAFLLPTLIIMMKYSANYKGAWIYKTAPVKDVGKILKGTLKAFLVKLFLPVYLVECVLFIILLGTGIILNLIAIFLNILLFAVICFKISTPALPFSESFSSVQNGGWSAIPMLFVLAALGGVHYFSASAWFGASGVYAVILLSAAANLILWRKAFSLKWENIDGQTLIK